MVRNKLQFPELRDTKSGVKDLASKFFLVKIIGLRISRNISTNYYKKKAKRHVFKIQKVYV